MPSSGARQASHHRAIQTKAPRKPNLCEAETSILILLCEVVCLVPAESPETCLRSEGQLAQERYILVAPPLWE